MTSDLVKEWQYRKQRIDSLHDEAWSIQTVQHERMTEIWLEVQRHRARIGELAAMGVVFEERREVAIADAFTPPDPFSRKA